MPKVKRLVLGITGGIASGKSTVMHLLAGRGIPTVSSDDLAHACIRRGRPAYRAVVRRFGKDVLTRGGEVDRSKLGDIVFADPKKRKVLEKIVHPCVVQGLKDFVRRHPKGIIALDIPLLFESRLQGLVDKTIVIYSTRAQQIARLRWRSGLSRPQALARLRAQMPLGQKCRRADIVVQNTHSIHNLQKQVSLISRLYFNSKE